MTLLDQDQQHPKHEQYNGLNNLKKAGVQVQLTQAQQQQLVKCKNDFFYFLQNYVYIMSLDAGSVKFKPFNYQKRMMKKAIKNRFTLVMWCRQSGKSTSVAALLLWYAIFNKKYNIYICAQQRGQAVEILDRIKEMYELLPWWLQPGVFSWNGGSIRLGNKSKIVTAATSGSGVRGKTVHLLYLDEFAFVQNDVQFYTATYPVVTSGSDSKIIITSTPNGMNLFYKLWTQAQQGKNAYTPESAHWSQHPKRNKKWYQEQMRNMSERQFSQQFQCKFLGSSDTLLSPNTLQKLTYRDPVASVGDNKDFKIYQMPQSKSMYCITVDVSEGVGRDYSVISVFDVTQAPYRQVGMLRSNIIPPLVLADLTNRIAKDYNDAYVLIQSNTYGKQVCDSLWNDYEYQNMMLSKGGDTDTKLQGGAYHRIQPGIKTTKTTKRVGCSTLKGLIESSQLLLCDFQTIQQLNSFTAQGNGSYAAEKGKNDDIAMTLVLFAWFTAQPYFSDAFDVNTRQLIRQNIFSDQEYQDEFGFLDDGLDDNGVSADLFRSFL